jgi:hypothetical protein
MAVRGSVRRLVATAAVAAMIAVSLASAASAELPTPNDPRVGLSAGDENAGTASKGVELLTHLPKPAGFRDPNNPGSIAFANSDLAFQGNHAFIGNFNGFNIYDLSDGAHPVLQTSVVCPGGQGDLSVYGNLLFMSVEENRAKLDCTLTPPATAETRFRGVRVFDISNLNSPVQVAAVQTCRGSHTHTLVTDSDDPSKVYIYVQGTAGVRQPTELAGCNTTTDPAQPNPSRWRIEVIEVPVAAPQNARVVNEPRLFKDDQTGRIDSLQNQPQTPLHPSGTPWSPSPTTDSCHDITVYPEIGLAAGACEGNGLLIDISDPANPKRLDAVADPLYAYWHGATFSNDGRSVIFTDEWGGGTGARCRATDDLTWGGDSIYDIVDGKLVFRSYYKLPVVQTSQENCVSHLPSLVPVPGRDIFVQAWYQGGVSLVDFTDSAHPVEIGYFDRGPFSATGLVLSGFWSTYWYNGQVYGSEIGRGFDTLRLTPTAQLSANEIAAAREAVVDRLNVQHQDKLSWAPSFAVVRSYADQLHRLSLQPGDSAKLAKAEKHIDKAEGFWDGPTNNAARSQLRVAAGQLPSSARFDNLRQALNDLADS